MEIIGTAKHFAKYLRWQGRRFRAAQKWGKDSFQQLPVIFGNAMPKSGSHLLTQVLFGLTEIGPFVDPGFPPVNRTENNQPRSEKAIVRSLLELRHGDIRYGYLHAREPYLSLLTKPGWATIFIYRDPRDMLVSHVFYATDMYHGHGMHRYYTEHLKSMEERLDAAIEGVRIPGFELASVRERYDSYLGWLRCDEILSLRFEDFILKRKETLARLLDYLSKKGFRSSFRRDHEIAVLEKAIQPGKSGTFRKGQPGNWRDHFTDENKERFKTVAGDLLQTLGYEENNDW